MKYKVEVSICERDFEQVQNDENILAQAENREPKSALDLIKDSVMLNISKKAAAQNIIIKDDNIQYETEWVNYEPDEDCPACRKLIITCHFEGLLQEEQEKQ